MALILTAMFTPALIGFTVQLYCYAQYLKATRPAVDLAYSGC